MFSEMDQAQHEEVRLPCLLTSAALLSALRLIERFEESVIVFLDDDWMTLIHMAIMNLTFTCAQMLFDYAAENDLVVGLSWHRDDILGWSISHQIEEAVVFVLERITTRCAPLSVSATVLKKTFPRFS